MSLEDLTGSGKYISDLDEANPTGIDVKSDGDNHMRGIKNVIKNTFSAIIGAVTASHTELNYVTGVTSGIQAQLDVISGLVTANTAAIGNVDSVQTGDIIMRSNSTVSTAYFECDGATKDTTAEADLFAAIGYVYGGSGANFNLPDLRGQFPRGWDHGAGVDPDAGTRTGGDTVGSTQADEFKSHIHTKDSYGPQYAGAASGVYGVYANTSGSSTGSAGGNETRPVNTNVMFAIKR